jgi:hypothetical protein
MMGYCDGGDERGRVISESRRHMRSLVLRDLVADRGCCAGWEGGGRWRECGLRRKEGG